MQLKRCPFSRSELYMVGFSTLYFLWALVTLMARWATMMKLVAPVITMNPYSLERMAISALDHLRRAGTDPRCTAECQ